MKNKLAEEEQGELDFATQCITSEVVEILALEDSNVDTLFLLIGGIF